MEDAGCGEVKPDEPQQPLTAIDSAVPNSSSLMRPLGMSLEPIIADVSYIGSTENSPTKRFSLHIVNRGQACLAAPVR